MESDLYLGGNHGKTLREGNIRWEGNITGMVNIMLWCLYRPHHDQS